MSLPELSDKKMTTTLDIGLTQEELREQVLARASNRIVDAFVADEQVSARMEKMVRDALDVAVNRLAEETVAPLVAGIIENVVLQKTNDWGEATGLRVTFREYLVQRAEGYMREPVNYEGKTRAEANGYSWSKSQERITHMIDRHLHYSIETAMKDALATANSHIVEGIEATVKTKLAEVSKAMKVKLEKPR